MLRVGNRTASVPVHLIERSGKHCVFVKSPSAAALERALIDLQPVPST